MSTGCSKADCLRTSYILTGTSLGVATLGTALGVASTLAAAALGLLLPMGGSPSFSTTILSQGEFLACIGGRRVVAAAVAAGEAARLVRAICISSGISMTLDGVSVFGTGRVGFGGGDNGIGFEDGTGLAVAADVTVAALGLPRETSVAL